VSMPVPVVWSEDCLRHEPAGEVWLGVRDPGTEVPGRALVLRAALEQAGFPVREARPHDDAILRTVHHPQLVGHLAGIWADWDQAGLPAEYGRDRVVPYLFPTGAMLAGLPLRVPPAAHARADTQPGAKWSDGKPLTAADAAWTYSTIIKFQSGPTPGTGR
jgi:acetoin utilization deacetylase AcuC-like enzyme